MTAGTHPIDYHLSAEARNAAVPATVVPAVSVGIVPFLRAVAAIPRSAHGHFQQAGMIGAVHDVELGRHLGART